METIVKLAVHKSLQKGWFGCQPAILFGIVPEQKQQMAASVIPDHLPEKQRMKTGGTGGRRKGKI